MLTAKRIGVLSILLFLFFSPVLSQNRLIPHADAVVVCGKARFTVLTPQMIRIQWSEAGLFSDDSTAHVVRRDFDVPPFSAYQEDGYLHIRTSVLHLRYKLAAKIELEAQQPESLCISFLLNGHQVIWYPGKPDAMNLRGTAPSLLQYRGVQSLKDEPTGILSRAGWSFLEESVTPSSFDAYFLGYGYDFRQALADVCHLMGGVVLPPTTDLLFWAKHAGLYIPDEDESEEMQWRYRLIPYLYTALLNVAQTGYGVTRPLYYDYPFHNQAYQYEDEYLLGNDVLVAPLVSYRVIEERKHRSMWLPDGEWWDYTNQQMRQGPSTFVFSVPEQRFPCFFRAGSVIPILRESFGNPSEIQDTLVLLAVPGKCGSGSLRGYTGKTLREVTPSGLRMDFHQQTNGDTLTLKIMVSHEDVKIPHVTRHYQIDFLGRNRFPRSLTVNGIPSEKYFMNEEHKCLSVLATGDTITLNTEVQVVF